MNRMTIRPVPLLLGALLAAVVALGGVSEAARLVTGKQIKNGSVTGIDLKNGSVKTTDLGPGVVAAEVVPRKRVVATAGPNEADARAAAPQVTLFRKGALTVYGKCFSDAGETFAETFIKTSRDGSIFSSRVQTLAGGLASDFLNTESNELDRRLEVTRTFGSNAAALTSADDSDFTAFAPDGTELRGWTGAAAKDGTLVEGNGVYGAGDVCLFTGGVFAG